MVATQPIIFVIHFIAYLFISIFSTISQISASIRSRFDCFLPTSLSFDPGSRFVCGKVIIVLFYGLYVASRPSCSLLG